MPIFQSYSILLVILAGVLAGGCTRTEPKADLVIINGQEVESLDPALVSSVEGLRAVMALFEGLTRNDPETARPIPGLAATWDLSPDGTVYTFHLRTNAFWSTGEAITADDVVYSWRRVLDPMTAANYASQLFPIRGAADFNSGKLSDPGQLGFRAIDRHTLRVELDQPTPYFLDLCAFQTLAVVPRWVIEKHGDAWLKARPLPCSGAFQLETWRLNDRIRLHRNARYWDAANTALEVVDLRPVLSPNTALNLYETKVADIIWDKDLVPAELLPELRKRPDFQGFRYLGTYFVRINVTHPPFNDPRVRRALVCAVDRERLVAKISSGETAARTFVPPGTANHEAPEGLSFNPELARRLLAEAGFPGGNGFRPFKYLFDASGGGGARIHGKIAVELQEVWRRELGITMELQQMEKQVYIAAQKGLEYDLSRSSWIGDYNDPNTFLDVFLSNNGNNRTGWSNARYDQMIRDANRVVDLAKRAEILREAEALLVSDEAVIMPLYWYSGFNLFDGSRITGVYKNILDVHPINAIRKRTNSDPQHAAGSGPQADFPSH